MNDGTPPADSASPSLGDNSAARYAQVKEGFERLRQIEEEKAKLNAEAEKIRANLEKDAGINRGALADIGRLSKLSPTAIKAREESRTELFELFVKPKLDEAAQASGGDGEE